MIVIPITAECIDAGTNTLEVVRSNSTWVSRDRLYATAVAPFRFRQISLKPTPASSGVFKVVPANSRAKRPAT